MDKSLSSGMIFGLNLSFGIENPVLNQYSVSIFTPTRSKNFNDGKSGDNFVDVSSCLKTRSDLVK